MAPTSRSGRSTAACELSLIPSGPERGARCGEPQRFVDPMFVLQDVGRNPDRTYAILKDSGLFEKGISYDNNGPRGSEPTIRDTFGTAHAPGGGPGRNLGGRPPAGCPEGEAARVSAPVEAPTPPHCAPEVTTSPPQPKKALAVSWSRRLRMGNPCSRSNPRRQSRSKRHSRKQPPRGRARTAGKSEPASTFCSCTH